MAKATKIFLAIVACLMLVVGVAGQAGVDFPSYADTAIGWVYSSSPVQSVIVEESGDRPKLPASQIQALAAAPGMGVFVIDKDVLGPGKKPAPVLQHYLDEAKDKPLPQLVRKWSNGRTTSVACPLTTDELRKAVSR